MDDPIYMEFGRFKGQPIDARTRRSVKLLNQTDSHYVIDYFFHHGTFYLAKIPIQGLESIYGQRFNFKEITQASQTGFYNPFLNHAQIRLQFSKDTPVTLFPLGSDSDSCDKPLHTITDIIYSVEIVGPKGTTWSLPLSFGDMVAAHRMMSMEEMVFERLVLKNYLVKQSPPLLLSNEEIHRGLEIIIKNADAAGMSQPYYLIRFLGARNCTSELFSILDSVISNRYSFVQKCISKILWRLPIGLKKYLSFRGVFDSSNKMPTVNEEFEEFLTSQEIQDRKENILNKNRNSVNTD